jgi:hypothetical protein
MSIIERSWSGTAMGMQALSPSMENTKPPERPSIFDERGLVAVGQALRGQRIHRIDAAKELPLIGREFDPFALARFRGVLGH